MPCSRLLCLVDRQMTLVRRQSQAVVLSLVTVGRRCLWIPLQKVMSKNLLILQIAQHHDVHTLNGMSCEYYNQSNVFIFHIQIQDH